MLHSDRRRVTTRHSERSVTSRQLTAGAIALVAVTLAGTGGFVLTGDSPLDALYRTINTLTTAGAFNPPHSAAGKALTIAILVCGVALFLYIVGLLVELVVGGVATGAWTQRRMDTRLERLHDHRIICGYGRVGTRVARDLKAAGIEFVVLDSSEEAIDRARTEGVLHMEADGSDDTALRRAGVERAAGLVACVDDDAANVYIVLTAKGIRSDLHVVARASSDAAAAKMRRAGADAVVSPYAIAGERIAGMLVDLA
jgi:voltage-gated potassium channel